MFEFIGLPEQLYFGDEIAIKIEPTPEYGLLLVFKSDSNKNKLALMTIDQCEYPLSTLFFRVPDINSKYITEWITPSGLYLIEVHAVKNGEGNGESYLVSLS